MARGVRLGRSQRSSGDESADEDREGALAPIALLATRSELFGRLPAGLTPKGRLNRAWSRPRSWPERGREGGSSGINLENFTVPFTAHTEAPPLGEDTAGALRVGDSRVLLELVIRAFQDGATPEAIVQRYPTLALPDVYSVIAYYLRHRGEIEAYLGQREQLAEESRQRIERQQGDLSEIRVRLLARRPP